MATWKKIVKNGDEFFYRYNVSLAGRFSLREGQKSILHHNSQYSVASTTNIETEDIPMCFFMVPADSSATRIKTVQVTYATTSAVQAGANYFRLTLCKLDADEVTFNSSDATTHDLEEIYEFENTSPNTYRIFRTDATGITNTGGDMSSAHSYLEPGDMVCAIAVAQHSSVGTPTLYYNINVSMELETRCEVSDITLPAT